MLGIRRHDEGPRLNGEQVVFPHEPRHIAHPLDTQSALPRHHVPDVAVDAGAPDVPVRWRRASTVCKAPLKKSTSSIFSAKRRFNWLTSLRSVDSRAFTGGPSLLSTGLSFSRHVYSRRRDTPSSWDSATMFSHWFSRSTASCRNAFG